MDADDTIWQVWQAPGGKTHLVCDWGDLEVACRRRWPLYDWTRLADDTPVTCGSCRRSSYARMRDNGVAEVGKG